MNFFIFKVLHVGPKSSRPLLFILFFNRTKALSWKQKYLPFFVFVWWELLTTIALLFFFLILFSDVLVFLTTTRRNLPSLACRVVLHFRVCITFTNKIPLESLGTENEFFWNIYFWKNLVLVLYTLCFKIFCFRKIDIFEFLVVSEFCILFSIKYNIIKNKL